MPEDTTPADVPDTTYPAIPGNDSQIAPGLVADPATVPDTTNVALPNDVVNTPSTVNGTPVDEAPSAETTNGGNLNPDVTDIQVTPADATNEVNQIDPAALETQEIELLSVGGEDDIVGELPENARVIIINRPTTYFEVAQVAEVTISPFELANRNGVHNSVYDLNVGDVIVIPAPQLPVPPDPPAVSLEDALEQAAVTQNAAQALQAQAIDIQAGIDPQFAANAAGVPVVDIPNSTPPSSAAVADDPIPVDVDAAAAAATVPAFVEGTPDTITTPDHPTIAKIDPEPDIISTPDHPSDAKVDVLPDVSAPAGTVITADAPAPDGAPVDVTLPDPTPTATDVVTDAPASDTPAEPVVLDPPVSSDEAILGGSTLPDGGSV